MFWLTEKLVYSIIKNGMKDYIARKTKTDFGRGEGSNFFLPTPVKVVYIVEFEKKKKKKKEIEVTNVVTILKQLLLFLYDTYCLHVLIFACTCLVFHDVLCILHFSQSQIGHKWQVQTGKPRAGGLQTYILFMRNLYLLIHANLVVILFFILCKPSHLLDFYSFFQRVWGTVIVGAESLNLFYPWAH